jgi:membrane protease YdiL (CAAX protease family)
MKFNKIMRIVGPIALSALSILIVSLLINPIACWLDPSFHLLANRGVGKVAFTTIVILHILQLFLIGSRHFFETFLDINLRFFKNKRWIVPFFTFFLIFFVVHVALLAIFYLAGYATYNHTSSSPSFGSLAIGFLATFFLAWSEEVIFRGTLYLYFLQHIRPIESILLTSGIFALVHDLTNPLNLVTKNWKLGLGLFLLGILLNLTFAITNKLYTGMGIHAGLVFVKVVLRRWPIIAFLPVTQLPCWVDRDLRQSFLIHGLFTFVNIILIIKYKKKLFQRITRQNRL